MLEKLCIVVNVFFIFLLDDKIGLLCNTLSLYVEWTCTLVVTNKARIKSKNMCSNVCYAKCLLRSKE